VTMSRPSQENTASARAARISPTMRVALSSRRSWTVAGAGLSGFPSGDGIQSARPMKGEFMQLIPPSPSSRRGITVLTLLLIVIAVIVAAIFLIRYLRQPA
jgi:hypothetical protein